MTRYAPVNMIWTAVMERCRAKYFERAYRYVWWDSATIGQNFLLGANALGLGACLMGSWYDDLAHELRTPLAAKMAFVIAGATGELLFPVPVGGASLWTIVTLISGVSLMRAMR